MTIPTEAWPIIAVIFGAIGFWVRQRGSAKLEQETRLRIDAESRAFQVEGEAKVKIAQATAEAEIKLSAAREDAEERGFMRAQLQAQLKLNEQFQDLLIEKEKKDEGNYRVLADVQIDTNRALVNLWNKTEENHTTQIAAIGGLPGAIQIMIGDTLKTYAEQLGAEIGSVLTKQFQLQSLEREMYPFPDPEDSAWQTLFLKPIIPSPTIHKQPYFADAVKLHKPCAVIPDEGEWVRAIMGRLRDWIIVEKRAGDSHCWGWLPAHTVQISEPASPVSA